MGMTGGGKTNQNKPKGSYVVWVFYGYEGWSFYDAETIDDALAKATNAHGHYWVITPAPVRLAVTESHP
jgi:hypothetical protein